MTKGLPGPRWREGFQSAGFEEDPAEVIRAVVGAEPGVLEDGGEVVAAQAVDLRVAAPGMALQAVEAVDVDAVLGKVGVVRVGASVDPVVAREARLDRAAAGAAFAGQLGRPEPQKRAERKRGGVVQPGQVRRAIRRDIEREEAQEITEVSLRNSPRNNQRFF